MYDNLSVFNDSSIKESLVENKISILNFDKGINVITDLFLLDERLPSVKDYNQENIDNFLQLQENISNNIRGNLVKPFGENVEERFSSSLDDSNVEEVKQSFNDRYKVFDRESSSRRKL